MRGIQIGLLDLLLFISVVGVAIGYKSVAFKNRQMLSDIREMKQTAGELIIDDKLLLSAETNKSDFADVTRRDFFVPAAGEYEICFSTEVGANAPQVQKRMDVGPGTHWIDIRERHNRDGFPRVVAEIEGRSVWEKEFTHPQLKEPMGQVSKILRSRFKAKLGDD